MKLESTSMLLHCVVLKPGTSFAELRTSCALPRFGSVKKEKSLGKFSVSGLCLSVCICLSYDGLVDKPS